MEQPATDGVRHESTGAQREIGEPFQRLRRLVDATGERISRFSDLDPHIRDLEDLIFSLDDSALTAEMFLAGLSPSDLSLQQVAYSQWETELERRFAGQRPTRRRIDDYALAGRFRRLIEREVELLNGAGPRPERLLFIGSGPVPISGILMHEYLGVPVHCVDADPVAVQASRELLSQVGLSQAIQVHHAEGSVIDLAAYDAILIALLAKPKRDILAHVARSARSDCRVVCRSSRGLRVLVYEPMRLERDLHRHAIKQSRWACQPGDTISSLLLTRGGV